MRGQGSFGSFDSPGEEGSSLISEGSGKEGSFLFLEGPRGVGKSWMLEQALAPLKKELAGYFVQRILEGEGRSGFRAVRAGEGPGPQDVKWRKESRPICGREGVFSYGGKADPGVLEGLILETVQQVEDGNCRLVLLDEIGGMELLSPAVLPALIRILDSGIPCVGVLKSEENLFTMTERRGLDEVQKAELFSRYNSLREKLSQKGGILMVTEETKKSCREKLEEFLKEAMNGYGDLPEKESTRMTEHTAVHGSRRTPWHPIFKLQLAGEEIFLGPGSFELLNLIEETGSVRGACERMGISYSKAWKILNRLEAQTGFSVLLRKHGGKAGGETVLTEEGRRLLQRFAAFEKECRQAVGEIFERYFGEEGGF